MRLEADDGRPEASPPLRRGVQTADRAVVRERQAIPGDQGRVRVDLGAAAPVPGRFRRHVIHVGVFRDSGAVHVRPPRDL